MSVRAKFKYTGYEASLSNMPTKNADGNPGPYEQVELRSLKFSPVYGNGDPNHENTTFWNASPTGQIALGCVNPAAWQQFEIGKEYYIDFTPA